REWKEEQVRAAEAQAVATHYAESYDKVLVLMREYEVEELFGSAGQPIRASKWPKVLGDVTGAEDGWSKFHDPRAKIQWKLWRVPKPERGWIAVGFCGIETGGITSYAARVVAKKRHGL